MTLAIQRFTNDLIYNNAVLNHFKEEEEDTLNKYGINEFEKKLILGRKPEVFDDLALSASSGETRIASFFCSKICSSVCSQTCTHQGCTYGSGGCI